MGREYLSQSLAETKDLQHFVRVIESFRTPSRGEDVTRVETTFLFANMIVAKMSNISPNPEQMRTGGVMAIGNTGENDFLVIRQVGTINSDPKRNAADKIRKYTNVVLGKIGALLEHPEYVSSRENLAIQDDEAKLYTEGIAIPGGAIRYGNQKEDVLGFSGFGTPEEDDCICLSTKIFMGELTINAALDIASKTNNKIFPQVVNYLLGYDEEIPVVV